MSRLLMCQHEIRYPVWGRITNTRCPSGPDRTERRSTALVDDSRALRFAIIGAVIAATGVLHHPKLPDIDGLDEFEGAMFHSARWDHDVRLDGARVGIVGTGSTAVQMVSALVGRVEKLSLFQRTAQWIMPQEN